MSLRSFQFCGTIWNLILIFMCTAITSDNEIFVDEVMQDYNDNRTSVPGASVLVIYKDVPIIRRSYGFANMEEQTYVTLVTNFRLASLTKQFTAAAILLFAEEKNRRLQLDDRIREKWLPTLPEAASTITVRHLLTHTSGLIYYEDFIDDDADCDALWGERPNSIRGCNLSVIDICLHLSFAFVPSNAWEFEQVFYM